MIEKVKTASWSICIILALCTGYVKAEPLSGMIPCDPKPDATGAARAVKRDCPAIPLLTLEPILKDLNGTATVQQSITRQDSICLDEQCLKFEQINLAIKILAKLNMPQGPEIIIPKEWVKK